MNDEHDPQAPHDPDDWVRDLLAEEGRRAEPMPPAVAQRLDRVLADLAAGESVSPEPPGSRVVAMTPRRHRRWGAALLAAAAVTVGGYSVGATGLLDQVTGGGVDESSAGSAADSEADSGGASAPEATSDRAGGSPPRDLSSQSLRRDATGLLGLEGLAGLGATLDTRDPVPAEGSKSGPDELSTATRGYVSPQDRALLRDQGCLPPPASVTGRRVAVRLDGEPATAVVRRDADRAVVQVWSCEAPTLLAAVTLPLEPR